MEHLVAFGSSKGDVLIVLSENHIAQTHSAIIRECCANIGPHLTEEKGAKLNMRALDTTSIRWRVDLVYDNGEYSFISKRVSEFGRSEPTYGINHEVVDPVLLNAMMDTFKMFYHSPLKLEPRLRPLLANCLRYVQAAKILGALPSVSGPVENAILNCSDEIWPHIAKHPAEWLTTAHRLESKSLFKEALIHTIGQWKTMSVESRTKIAASPQLRQLIRCKLSDTWQIKKTVERRVLAYHPQTLKDVKKDSRIMKGEAPGRAVYSTHIFPWIALCLYRQWFGQMIAEGCGLLAADGGYTLYTAMSQGAEKYLKHTEVQSFYEIFPMTDKAKTVVENTMNIIKEGVKELVIPVVAQKANANDVKHLTCTDVDEEDYPWISALSNEVLTKAEEYISKNPELGIWCPVEPVSDVQTIGRLGINDLLGDYGLRSESSKKRAIAAMQAESASLSRNVKLPEQTFNAAPVEEPAKKVTPHTPAEGSASKTQKRALSYDGSDDSSESSINNSRGSANDVLLGRPLALTAANLARFSSELENAAEHELENEIDDDDISSQMEPEIMDGNTQEREQTRQRQHAVAAQTADDYVEAPHKRPRAKVFHELDIDVEEPPKKRPSLGQE